MLLDDRQELLPVLKGSDRCPPRVIISSKQVVRVALSSRLLQRPTDIHTDPLKRHLSPRHGLLGETSSLELALDTGITKEGLHIRGLEACHQPLLHHLCQPGKADVAKLGMQLLSTSSRESSIHSRKGHLQVMQLAMPGQGQRATILEQDSRGLPAAFASKQHCVALILQLSHRQQIVSKCRNVQKLEVQWDHLVRRVSHQALSKSLTSCRVQLAPCSLHHHIGSSQSLAHRTIVGSMSSAPRVHHKLNHSLGLCGEQSCLPQMRLMRVHQLTPHCRHES